MGGTGDMLGDALAEMRALRAENADLAARLRRAEAEASAWRDAMSAVLTELSVQEPDVDAKRGFLAISARIVLRQIELQDAALAPSDGGAGWEDATETNDSKGSHLE